MNRPSPRNSVNNAMGAAMPERTTGPAKRRRSRIRVRLTWLYAGAFFVAGAALIALTYAYLDALLDHSPDDRSEAVERHATEFGHEAEEGSTADLHAAFQAQFAQERREALRAMLVWSVAAVAVVGVLAAAIGWLLAGRALHPLRRITATARRVADRSLHERICLDGPEDEIKDLADTFDDMLARLDRSFDGQRRFVANASHELRTPLALGRTLIEVALDDP